MDDDSDIPGLTRTNGSLDRNRTIPWNVVELMLAEAQDTGPVQSHTLDLNSATFPLHNFFKREHWEVSHEEYDLLLPSMQLASNLLHVGEDFLASLVPSNRVHYELDLCRQTDDLDYVVPFFPISADSLQETREELKEIAKVVKWQLNDTMAKDKKWLGITRLVTEDKWGPRPWTDLDTDAVESSDQDLYDRGVTRRPLIIAIMKEYVDALKSLATNSEARLRATFLAAITMTHEIAHTVWHQDFRSLEYDSQGREPYFDDDCVAELGLSFIAFIFNNRDHGKYIPSQIDKQVPTNFQSPLIWETVHSISENALLYETEFAISIPYLQMILSQEFWESLGPPGSTTWGPEAREAIKPLLDTENVDFVATACVRQWTVSRYDGAILWKPNHSDRRIRDPKLLQNVTPEEKALAIAEIKKANPSAKNLDFGANEDDDEEGFGGGDAPATDGAASYSSIKRPVDDGYLRMNLTGLSGSATTRIEVRYRPDSAMTVQALKRRRPHDYDKGVDVDDHRISDDDDDEDTATWNDADFRDFFRINDLPVWGDKLVWMARHARYYDEFRNGSVDRAEIGYDSKGPIKRAVNGVEVYAWDACPNATTVAALKGELFTIGMLPANCTLNLYFGNDRQTPLQDDQPLEFYSPANWKNLWLEVSLPKPLVVTEPSTQVQTAPVYRSRLAVTPATLHADGRIPTNAPNGHGGITIPNNVGRLDHHENPLPVRATTLNGGGGGSRRAGGGPTPSFPAVPPSLKRAYDLAHNNVRPTVTELLDDISSSAAELAKIVLPQGGRDILRPHLRSMRTTSAVEMLDSLEDLQEVREERQHTIDMLVDPVKTLEEDRKKRLADLKTLFPPGTKFDAQGRVVGAVPGANGNGNVGRTRANAGSHMADLYARLRPQG